jgi:hypothetical protein
MKDVFAYIWKNKVWWMLPPVVILVITGILIYVSVSSPVSPFIYMLF